MKKIFLIPAALVIVAACNKMNDDSAVSVRVVKAEINAVAENVTSEPKLKVTFDGETLVWEGGESLGVIIGNNSSATGQPATYSTQELPQVSGAPGCFRGDLVFQEPFSTNDILGVVYPFSDYCWARYNNGLRIVMAVGAKNAQTVRTQVQLHNNVLNGANAPLFAKVKSADLWDGTQFRTENLTLNWGCSLVRFNIYGRCEGMEDGEIFKNVSMTSNSGKGIVGLSEYALSTNDFKFNASKNNPVKVSLTEACTIADKTAENGIKVFAALLPRGSEIMMSTIVVTTDKAKYEKTVSKSLNLNTGTVSLVGLNLASFTRTPITQ